VAMALLAVACSQTVLPPGTVSATENIPAGGSCQANCTRDFYDCRVTVCSNGVCGQVEKPDTPRQSCADLRNATNYDFCQRGICVAAFYPGSTFVQLNLVPTTQNIPGDYAYPRSLQSAIANASGLDPNNELPNVRTCFETTQRLQGVVDTVLNQQIIRTCQMAAPLIAINGALRTYVVYVEIISGPTGINTNGTALTVATLANASAFSALGVASGNVLSSNPFLSGPEFVPCCNGYYLGISIGVACAVFVATILGCVVFYWVKSAREIQGAVLGQTDSTASVQSGSSFRSESHASATE